MKKLRNVLFCMAVIFTVTGCSLVADPVREDQMETTTTTTTTTTTSRTTTTTTTTSTTSVRPVYTTTSTTTAKPVYTTTQSSTSSKVVEEYVALARDQVRQQSTSEYTMDIVARNNSLVYIYTYKKTYNSSEVNIIKRNLDSGINAQKQTFVNMLGTIQASIPEVRSIILEYRNGDNKLISTYDMK